MSAGGAAAAVIAAGCRNVGDVPCTEVVDGPRNLPKEDWARHARIGGLEVFAEADNCQLGAGLAAFAAQGCTVVELDSELSFYLTEEQFEAQLDVLERAATIAHSHNMRAVAYFPSLDLLTPNAEETEHTAAKDHPEWIQRDIHGEPNVFIGGGGRVFWVEEGTESAWMCPTSGYVDYFLDRVRRLAATSLDGLWPDVPLLSDIAVEWTCTNDTCGARFKEDTGMTIPSEVDWEDAAFRRWVHWRHGIIQEFLTSILAAAREVDPNFEVVVETVTMDYNGCTIQGLDGASHMDGELLRVWEVDAVSDSTAMRHASADDWLAMAIMMRHGHGCSWPNPSWTFSYGREGDDSALVQGLALATGNGSFELKIPEMTTSVGPDPRKRVFDWFAKHTDLNSAKTDRPVGVIYSGPSRDYTDRNVGVGLYTSLNPDDELWWSDAASELSQAMPYGADYRGACKALILQGAPYEVVIAPRLTDAAGLKRYSVLILTSASALSDAQMDALNAWIEAGGTLLMTGPDTGLYDEQGGRRSGPAFLERLSLSPETKGWTRMDRGAGRVLHNARRAAGFVLDPTRLPDCRDNPSFDDECTDPLFADELATVLTAAGRPISVAVGTRVVADLRQVDSGAYKLICVNLSGLGEAGVGSFTPRMQRLSLSLDVGMTPSAVTVSTPDGDSVQAFQMADGRVALEFDVMDAAVVTLSASQSPGDA